MSFPAMSPVTADSAVPAVVPARVSPFATFAGAADPMTQAENDPWQQQQQQQNLQTPTVQAGSGPQAYDIGTGPNPRPVDIGVPGSPPGFPNPSGPQGSAAAYATLVQLMQAMRLELAELRAAQATAALSKPLGAAALPGASSAPSGAQAVQPRVLLESFNAIESDEVDLKDIDKKDVAPPVKYRGDAASWRHWYTKFTTFLARRDSRWGVLLAVVRKHSTNPYTDAYVQGLFALVSVKSEALVSKFKHQLYEYLETYTDGLTHSMVMSGGPMNAVEAFRQLCDEGFSARDRNLRKEYRKVAHPKQATFDGLKRAILDWENELAQYELASGKSMSGADKIMCLEDICPDVLQQHFETKENLKVPLGWTAQVKLDGHPGNPG